MSIKSRKVIWGGRVMGAKIRAKGSREGAKKAIREADRALKRARSIVEHGPNPTGQEAS